MRTPHGGFDGYHTSADGLDRISPAALEESVETCLASIDVLETEPHAGQPQPVRRAAARPPRALPLGRRRGRVARRRAGAAVGAQPERRQREPARHRRPLRHRLPGDPACGRAARAGGAAGDRPVVRPRLVSLGDEPLARPAATRCRRPGRPSARRSRPRARTRGSSGRRPRSRRRASGSPARSPPGRAAGAGSRRSARRRASRGSSASPGAGRPSRPRRRRACSARACSRACGASWKWRPRSVCRCGLWIVLPCTKRVGEPVLGELPLAEHARQEAALVAAGLDVDDRRVPQLRAREDHRAQPTATDVQRSSPSSRPASCSSRTRLMRRPRGPVKSSNVMPHSA